MTRSIKLAALLVPVICMSAMAKKKPEETSRVFNAAIDQVYAAAVQVASAGYNLKSAVKEGHTVNFLYIQSRYHPEQSFVLSEVCTVVGPNKTNVAVAVNKTVGNPQIFFLGKTREKLRKQFWGEVAVTLKDMPAQPAKSEASSSPPSKATVTVMSTPGGLDVLMDCKYVGGTPSTLHVLSGNHTFTISEQGYQNWQRTLTLREKDSITLNATLTPSK